jgi:hypothetical protein
LISRIIVRHEAIFVPAPFRASPNRRVIVAMASPEPYEKYPKLDLKRANRNQGKIEEVNGVKAEYHPDLIWKDRQRGSRGYHP